MGVADTPAATVSLVDLGTRHRYGTRCGQLMQLDKTAAA